MIICYQLHLLLVVVKDLSIEDLKINMSLLDVWHYDYSTYRDVL